MKPICKTASMSLQSQIICMNSTNSPNSHRLDNQTCFRLKFFFSDQQFQIISNVKEKKRRC